MKTSILVWLGAIATAFGQSQSPYTVSIKMDSYDTGRIIHILNGETDVNFLVILDENGGQVSNMRKAVKSVLSGDIDLAQMPNINTRENSPIEVKSTDIMIGSQFEIDMPPVSVIVVRTEVSKTEKET